MVLDQHDAKVCWTEVLVILWSLIYSVFRGKDITRLTFLNVTPMIFLQNTVEDSFSSASHYSLQVSFLLFSPLLFLASFEYLFWLIFLCAFHCVKQLQYYVIMQGMCMQVLMQYITPLWLLPCANTQQQTSRVTVCVAVCVATNTQAALPHSCPHTRLRAKGTCIKETWPYFLYMNSLWGCKAVTSTQTHKLPSVFLTYWKWTFWISFQVLIAARKMLLLISILKLAL